MSGKRLDYIDFDTFFMTTALIASERSKDPRTRVGAVIVKDNYIQSIGYNGTPKGMDDDIMPWDSTGEATGDLLQIKNSFVVHAEADALDNLPNGFNPNGSTLYVTLFPCMECAKRIVNLGIKKVVYLKEYEKSSNVVSNHMFRLAGVEVEKFTNLEKIKDALVSINNQIDLINIKENEKSNSKLGMHL